MKTKKRYHSAEEILTLIQTYRVQSLNLARDAEEADLLADALRNTSEAYRIEELRSRAMKKRKGIGWRTARLETLQSRLAEIQTPQLPALDNGDESVPSV